MDDDKTIIKPKQVVNVPLDDDRTVLAKNAHPHLVVDLLNTQGQIINQFSFSERFTVGRAENNNVVVAHDAVSRNHLEIKPEAGRWYLVNLKSTNGIYIDGRLIQNTEELHFPVLIALGVTGIYLRIQIKTSDSMNTVLPSAQSSDSTLAVKPTSASSIHRDVSQSAIEARLLAAEDTDDMGDYTLMARRVIHKDRVKRAKSYKKVIGWLLGLCGVAVGLVTYQHIALQNTQQLALDMFYDIKTLEVSLSQADLKLDENAELLDKTLQAINSEKLRISQEDLKLQQEKIAAEKLRMRQERVRLANMKAKYRKYVEQANSLRLRFPTDKQYESELIAKVARELGESELELPEDFVAEVRKYIQYWQSTSRLNTAINNMEQNNLLPLVTSALEQQGLPLYFIYLPLQESNYDINAIGPETRYGIAKGAWQLLAGTGQDFGVTPGPLADVREYDEQDGRFDFAQATRAATKYLKKIYSTEAQASGLLVMASYNYGDNRVKSMIKQMPDNPRDRNFWKFLQSYELPTETRDYVFFIFSAAVIGEDPQHFGFNFNPPLYKPES
jgi:peptidoglycan lytic transglycosylase D